MFDSLRWQVKTITGEKQQRGSGQPLAGWLATVCLRFARSKRRDEIGMEVIDRLSLGGRKSLLLVALEDRRFVVAVSGEQVPAVTELSQAATGDLTFGQRRIRWSGKRLSGKRASR